ncbi:mannonate dehydratase [Candidatus Latescibacterota bacterium]
MKRRKLGHVLAAGSIGAVFPYRNNAHSQPKKKSLMHVGGDDHSRLPGTPSTSNENLEFKVRHGVHHIDGGTPRNWNVDELLKKKEACEKYDISLEMFHVGIPRSITLATSERDRNIDVLCKRIEAAGKAGIRGLNYNFCILPNFIRTEGTPGRGGVTYSSFDISKVTDHSLTEAGRVTREESFERIAYLHERIIPVAEENKVQMGCHIADPPLKPNFRGVDRWNYPVFDGLKRFVETVPSAYHGFNFCVGSASEGLEDINDIYDIVRYFGERKKIFNVHFRNIRGGLNNMMEVFPDEGDIDMYKLAKVLRDVGYPYMLQPDHMPEHPDPLAMRQGFAFQYGYIKALIQAVNSELV